jgi:subtilase family serine protease
MEIALDVEWAHAIAPGANILLVEATNPQMQNLLAAAKYAGAHAPVVSMSWVGNEFRSETSLDSDFAVPGVTFVSAAGDTAGVTGYPAVSPYVVSVGGTSLQYAMVHGTLESWESAWSGGSGGVSAFEPKPPYEAGLPYLRLAMPDVSYSANPNYGYAVYDTYGWGGAVQVGGTSGSAPQWSALLTLADAQRAAHGLPSLSSLSTLTALFETVPYSDFYDVTTGRSGSHRAGPGYDLATGLGSPGNATALIAALAAAPDNLVYLPATEPAAKVAVKSAAVAEDLTSDMAQSLAQYLHLGSRSD